MEALLAAPLQQVVVEVVLVRLETQTDNLMVEMVQRHQFQELLLPTQVVVRLR